MENNPMRIEQSGRITKDPPTHLPLKRLGPDESHSYKPLVFQELANVNRSVVKEWYKNTPNINTHTDKSTIL
jgi:hypothetical protein